MVKLQKITIKVKIVKREYLLQECIVSRTFISYFRIHMDALSKQFFRWSHWRYCQVLWVQSGFSALWKRSCCDLRRLIGPSTAVDMWRTSISNTLQMNASSEYSQPRVSSGNDSRNWSSFQGSQLIQSRWVLFIVEIYWRVGNVRLLFDVYLLLAFEKVEESTDSRKSNG